MFYGTSSMVLYTRGVAWLDAWKTKRRRGDEATIICTTYSTCTCTVLVKQKNFTTSNERTNERTTTVTMSCHALSLQLDRFASTIQFNSNLIWFDLIWFEGNWTELNWIDANTIQSSYVLYKMGGFLCTPRLARQHGEEMYQRLYILVAYKKEYKDIWLWFHDDATRYNEDLQLESWVSKQATYQKQNKNNNNNKTITDERKRLLWTRLNLCCAAGWLLALLVGGRWNPDPRRRSPDTARSPACAAQRCDAIASTNTWYGGGRHGMAWQS